MGYRYIALIRDREPSGDYSAAIGATLHEMGLQHSLRTGPVELFVGADTPTCALSAGGVLIGHMFSHAGALITDGYQFPTFPCATQLRDYLLQNCWGEYLLFQPIAGDEHALTITREPSGGIPCVYSSPNNGCVFVTSDISIATGLNLYQKRIDWDYINRSLTYPHQRSARTGLAGVTELLPGCILRMVGATLVAEQIWNPWDFVATNRRHTEPREAIAQLKEAVTSAVSAWADVDRHILLELSGGLDSSIVAACLQRASARVVCCTLVTPVPGADERQYASLIAAKLGAQLRTEMLDFDKASISFVPATSTTAPRTGALHYAIDEVMRTAGENHGVTSFFSGSGGDTVFCNITNAAPAADAFRERGLACGISAIRNLSALHQCTLWAAARLTLRKLLRAPKEPHSPHNAFIDRSNVADLSDSHPWFDAPEDALPGDRERVFGLVDTLLYRETSSRATVRWRRMPLLAQPVVEACLKTPSWMWITGGENRAIARAAFADMLPPEILNRRSKGNFVNYLGGFYRRNKGNIRDLLLSGVLHERGLLDVTELRRFIDRDDLPMHDYRFLEILDLCMIENWIRHQH